MPYFGCVDHLTKAPKVNCTVRPDNKDDVLELLKQVKPDWPTAEVKLKKMEGGIINTMYTVWMESAEEEKLIVRIYFTPTENNEKLAEALDRSRELKNLEAISNLGIGPELIAVFNNGLCLKYLKGETLNAESIRSEEMIPYITKTIAKLNAQPVPDWRCAWDTESAKDFFIFDFPPDLRDPERTKKLLELLPNKEAVGREVEFISQLHSTIQSDRVFCHTDTKGENLIWNKDTKSMYLIDFEHSGSNTQSSEIGSHFVSYTDVLKPRPNCFPDRDFQLKWIRRYLRDYYEATGREADDVSDVEVEQLYVDANKSALIAKFMVGVGCLGLISNGVFDSFEFCMIHLKEYFESKNIVAALQRPT